MSTLRAELAQLVMLVAGVTTPAVAHLVQLLVAGLLPWRTTVVCTHVLVDAAGAATAGPAPAPIVTARNKATIKPIVLPKRMCFPSQYMSPFATEHGRDL